MARYRANQDIDDGKVQFKEGDEVDVNEIPNGYFGRFTLVTDEVNASDKAAGGGAGDEADKSFVTNPELSRDELKEKAAELGLSYPGNIPTEKLRAMVEEADAEE